MGKYLDWPRSDKTQSIRIRSEGGNTGGSEVGVKSS